jgi:hypothetical protein
MPDSRLYDYLPDPPENLTDYTRTVWQRAGSRLLQENKLSGKTLELLKNLCYWEQRKESTVKRMSSGHVPGIAGKPASETASKAEKAYSKNLKAIQSEIEDIRVRLGLDSGEDHFPAGCPMIPNEVFDNLPGLLRECCSLIPDRRNRDIFLLSSLPVISIHLCSMAAEYSKGILYPDLNVLLVCSNETENPLIRQAMRLSDELYRQLSETGSQLPVPAAPADAESLVKHLRSFRRGCTIVGCELTSRMVKQDKSADLLGVLMQESSQGGGVHLESTGRKWFLDEVRLSSLFHLDADTAVRFVSGSRVGLTAALSFYGYESEKGWISFRPDAAGKELSVRVQQLSSRLASLYKTLSLRPESLSIILDDSQWQLIDETFSEKMEIVSQMDAYGYLKQTTRNMALTAVRLAMIFTALRSFDSDSELVNKSEVLIPSDEDMFCAIWTADTLIKHTIRFISRLPTANEKGKYQDDVRGDRYQRFLETLPVRFETSEALAAAKLLGIPPRTAKRYLKEYATQKKISRIQRGLYQKEL